MLQRNPCSILSAGAPKRKPPSGLACGGHTRSAFAGENGIFGFAVSRILSNGLSPTETRWMIIPLGSPLLTTSSDLTRKLCTGRAFCASLFGLAPRRVLLFSLQQLVLRPPFRVARSSRSRYRGHCPGHSLCSTVPQPAGFKACSLEGRYPLRYPTESGLSSLVLQLTFHKA